MAFLFYLGYRDEGARKEGEADVSKGIRAGDGNPERVPTTGSDPSGGLS